MVLFFFDQSNRIERWHSGECAESSYTQEEVQAGYEEISKKFGFRATLDSMAGGDMEKEDFILKQSVFRVYLKIQLNSQMSAASRRHDDIIRRKR